MASKNSEPSPPQTPRSAGRPVANLTPSPKLSHSRSGSGQSNVSNSSYRYDIVSERIVQIILPVTICALYCSVLIRILSWNLTPTEPNLLDSTWRQFGLRVGGDSSEPSVATDYLIVVSVFIVLIIVVTLVILFIFYMRWQQCLLYYFYVPSIIILAIVTPAFLRSVLQSLNCFAVDIFTTLIFIWNFTVLGMIAIFGIYVSTPLYLQQFYLIHNSALLAVLTIHALPGWAPWVLLSFLVLWDLFAVLAPCGPLKLIISLAEEEGIVEMPGLIYSTDTSPQNDGKGEVKLVRSSKKLPSASNEQPRIDKKTKTSESDYDAVTIKSDDTTLNANNANSEPRTRDTSDGSNKEVIPKQEPDLVEKGVSIGLGDFIFYSLLIGLASKGRHLNDFHMVLTTLNSVQFGLVLTLIILALTKRALPAIPISIGLGLVMGALTYLFVPQLSNCLASNSIFI